MAEPHPPTRDSPSGCLAAARVGSREALGRALEACRGYLLLIARRELGDDLQAKVGASDLVQETLGEAVRDFDRFQGESEEELLAWLRRLLLNNLADLGRHYREAGKRAVSREGPLDGTGSRAGAADGLATDIPSPSGAAMANERTDAVQGVLRRLPENYQKILTWRYQEGRSFDDIAAAMGLTANAARKLLLRAIRRVQEELGDA